MPHGRAAINTYRRPHRIRHAGEFRAVYDAKLRKSRGPFVIAVLPRSGPEHRLGLSIGKRLGNAVARGRLKRLIRECFRLSRHDLPRPATRGAYDIVVSMRPHDRLEFDVYLEHFRAAVQAAHREYSKRARRDAQTKEGSS